MDADKIFDKKYLINRIIGGWARDSYYIIPGASKGLTLATAERIELHFYARNKADKVNKITQEFKLDLSNNKWYVDEDTKEVKLISTLEIPMDFYDFKDNSMTSKVVNQEVFKQCQKDWIKSIIDYLHKESFIRKIPTDDQISDYIDELTLSRVAHNRRGKEKARRWRISQGLEEE